jgi:hypothetical protein
LYQRLLRRRPAPERQFSVLAARAAATNGHAGYSPASAARHETN